MKLIAALLVLSCAVSLCFGQWVVTTIALPDSLSGLSGIGAIAFHAPTHTIYVGGGSALVAVDASSYRKIAKVDLLDYPDVMCSSPVSNKVYCASRSWRQIWVVDAATNRFSKSVAVDSYPRELCYARAVNKVYVACPQSNTVKVIDCARDSLVATIGPLPGVSALCYNPGLNRIYSAQSGSDEVAVIDCAADTVMRTIWVRGVEPSDVCYDSVTNSVYTANSLSNTSSVIDCATDSVVRIVTVCDDPWNLLAGPQGKVFCAGDDTVVTVIDGGSTRTIPVGSDIWRSSYDPVKHKAYYTQWSSYLVTIVDAIGDSVLARVTTDGSSNTLCYDPVDQGTWAGAGDDAAVDVINGASDRVTDTLWFGSFRPGVLRYNPLNHHIYCLEEGWNSAHNHLAVVDGDSNRVLKILPAGGSCDSMLWNPVNNKLYISNSGDNTVSIVACANDSIVATISGRDWPDASCCSSDGKVYVCNDGYGVTVIDPVGDSVRKVIEVGHNPWGICYDRTDNKIYIGMWNDGDSVKVISVSTDSVVKAVAMPSDLHYQDVRWNQNHDKLYVSSSDDSEVVVIDCATDTILRTVRTTATGLGSSYVDSVTDRVYFADPDGTTLHVLDARADSFLKNVSAGSVGAMIDNRLTGTEHRLYSIGSYPSSKVAVVSGATDSVLRHIQVGDEPFGLAWNPVHSWVYVSNCDGSSITVVRDSLPAGIEESHRQASSSKPLPTVVRGILRVPASSVMRGASCALLDISGRKVLDLHPGANDVRALAPGVYFVREAQGQAQAQAHAVRKVVLTK
ncbi:MAG TPA: YncE family protein [bacterium]|nr:YncE family protein [bacterium]